MIPPSEEWPRLEEEADALLAGDRRERGDVSGGRDLEYPYLSFEQLKIRAEREVMPRSGVPDAAIIRGQYSRAHNPNITPYAFRIRRVHLSDRRSAGDPEFDARVPLLSPGSNFFESSFTRDPLLNRRPVRELDRHQRSRVRKQLRDSGGLGLHERLMLRRRLAEFFGVPIHVIVRLET